MRRGCSYVSKWGRQSECTALFKSDKIILGCGLLMFVIGWPVYFLHLERFYSALLGCLGMGIIGRYIIYFFVDFVSIRPRRLRERESKSKEDK